ncbi:MAG: acetyl-CoA carboxylase, carboxytransferase, alpha subunit, partial [Actinomycetota bacterium]
MTTTPPGDEPPGTTSPVGDQFDGEQTDSAPAEPNLPEDAQMVRRAAQRYGTVGAMLAGGMVVFDRLLGRKPKEEPAVVIEASTEPEDIESLGEIEKQIQDLVKKLAEEQGQGDAIAVNLREMFRLRVPIVATVIGEGGSGGAL